MANSCVGNWISCSKLTLFQLFVGYVAVQQLRRRFEGLKDGMEFQEFAFGDAVNEMESGLFDLGHSGVLIAL